MCEFYLIRHGMTPGNKVSRYIGSTDEGLSDEGREKLRQGDFFYKKEAAPELLFVSPMKRCRETAEILFPNMDQIVLEDLREFDFGIFENKNYQDLSDSREYQAWIDSFCEDPVPGGECRKDFQYRTCRAFEEAVRICQQKNISRAALVVHGGTIMSIMDEFVESEKTYYDWHVRNGDGYHVRVSGEDEYRLILF